MNALTTFFNNRTILSILIIIVIFLCITEIVYLIIKKLNQKSAVEESEVVREQRINTALEYETQGFEVEKREYENKIIFLEEKIHELENEMENFLVNVNASKMSTTNLADSLEQIESRSAKINQIKDAVANSENTSDLTNIVEEVENEKVLAYQQTEISRKNDELINELDRAVETISPDTGIHSDGETTLSDKLLEQGSNVEMTEAQSVANKYVEENIVKPETVPDELAAVKAVIMEKIENYANELISIKSDPSRKTEQLTLMKQLVDAKRMLQEYKDIEKDYLAKKNESK